MYMVFRRQSNDTYRAKSPENFSLEWFSDFNSTVSVNLLAGNILGMKLIHLQLQVCFSWKNKDTSRGRKKKIELSKGCVSLIHHQGGISRVLCHPKLTRERVRRGEGKRGRAIKHTLSSRPSHYSWVIQGGQVCVSGEWEKHICTTSLSAFCAKSPVCIEFDVGFASKKTASEAAKLR